MNRRRVEEDVPQEPAGESLLTKYRPKQLSEVVGQKPVVASLTEALRLPSRQHSYLFTGPSGTGKTTLARIVAKELHCDPSNLVEIDAASNSGIDDMRSITASLRYNGFGDSPVKAIVIDECHRLSKPAWDSLLKSVEEPPAHVFFFFCSTEPDKIPKAIETRSLTYNLSPVRFDDLMDLLEYVCEEEKLDTPNRFLTMIAQAAEGSPRAALAHLAKVHACDNEDEVAALLAAPFENAEVIDLCRLLVQGKLDWKRLCEVLKGLSDTPAESIRLVIVNYLNSCLLGARSEKDAIRLLDMLACFMKPCNPSEKLAPLLIAFGDILYV